ncbi:MAG: hypothetical protein QM715_07980 [Nibricoccus sp.]
MTPATVLRKPKLHFDTSANPSHVTFDDGKELKRNIPWLHYVEARWHYAEPDCIGIEIGEWVVVMHGYNLGPLFLAIEDRTLVRVRAQPDLGQDREREADTFVTEMRFGKQKGKQTGKAGALQPDLLLP